MPPHRDTDRKAARQEFQGACSTQELGRSLQRKMLQKRLDDFTGSSITAAGHGDEPSPESFEPPPREDRAG